MRLWEFNLILVDKVFGIKMKKFYQSFEKKKNIRKYVHQSYRSPCGKNTRRLPLITIHRKKEPQKKRSVLINFAKAHKRRNTYPQHYVCMCAKITTATHEEAKKKLPPSFEDTSL
jgi:hypothetical protein